MTHSANRKVLGSPGPRQESLYAKTTASHPPRWCIGAPSRFELRVTRSPYLDCKRAPPKENPTLTDASFRATSLHPGGFPSAQCVNRSVGAILKPRQCICTPAPTVTPCVDR